MAWKKESVMEQKTKFIEEAIAIQDSFQNICKKYNISRRVGYKYVQRFLKYGLNGLDEISRRPHSAPNQISEEIVCKIVNLKIKRPHWGAKKLHTIFSNEYPHTYLPSITSFDRILKKAGLTEPKMNITYLFRCLYIRGLVGKPLFIQCPCI